MCQGRTNEALEERVRLMRFALKLGMKLASNEKRVIRDFDDFNQLAIRGKPAEYIPSLLESLAVSVIELEAMPVALLDNERAVKPCRARSDDQLAWLRAQPHRSAFFCHAGLLVEHRD